MKSNIILLVTLCGAVLNVVLSNILVQKYSLNGVLVAMAVAFFANTYLSIYFSRKFIKINYDLKGILASIIVIIFFMSVSSLNFFSDSIFYKITFSISCFFILTTIVLLILKQKHVSFKN